MTTSANEAIDASAAQVPEAPSENQAPAGKNVSSILPGVGLTGGIAVVSYLLQGVPGPSALSPMILSILLGMALHNFVGTPAQAKAGIAFSLRWILRLGIILLGLQLTFAQVAEVGAIGISIIIVALLGTFVFTVKAGKLLGVDPKLSELIAAGTSICGASAVIATNTVTRGPDEDVAYAVACVTVFGSIAMFLYPMLAAPLHLDPNAYGLWIGASIHEVAQVVGAGFQNCEEAGHFGMIAKLSRVMLLAPLVIGLGLIARSRLSKSGEQAQANPPLPWFVFGFIALIAFNSFVSVPEQATSIAAMVTTFMLSMALAAMGLETDFSKLRAKGLRPLMLGFSASVFISVLCLILIKLFY